MAGALFALLPIVLHLVTRRPPAAAPLPTARFLEPERLIRVHLERRPTDLFQLFLRVLLVLALATAFAEPSWSAEGSGTASVVLLDGSPAMAPFWSEAVDSARQILSRSRVGTANTVVVFDSVTRVVSPTSEGLDSLAREIPGSSLGGSPGTSRGVASTASDSSRAASLVSATYADLAVALSALRERARLARSDSARAWIIFNGRRGSWRPGLGELRRSAWPGEIGVIAFARDSADSSTALVASPNDLPASLPFSSSFVFAEKEPDRAILQAALDALGVPAGAPGSAPSRETALLALAAAPTDPTPKQVLEAGGTVVLGPASYASVPDFEPIWRPDNTETSRAQTLIRFADGLAVRGAPVVSGDTEAGARWIAATGDGQPAAVAARVGEGCLVTAAFDLISLLPTAAASVPDVLARLLRGCESPDPSPDAALRLDAGSLAVLAFGFEGWEAPVDEVAASDTPAAAVVSPRAPRSGPPRAIALDLLRERAADPWLVRALLALALTLACVEAYLSYGKRERAALGNE